VKKVFRVRFLAVTLLIAVISAPAFGVQRKKKHKQSQPEPPNELSKLRDDYVRATKEYKASLERLVAIYEANVKTAEEQLASARKLFDEGLIAKTQLEEKELKLKSEQAKLADERQKVLTADSQIANVFVEAEADAELAKNLKLAKNRLVRTTSFVRFNGASNWLLSESGKIQTFFYDTFKKPLPIAVFGQGAIHDRWRLDHRNAMDIQLHPDGVEGQALLNFLQKNGIPYSAFRSAIPGTATGPHIHIGRPSHRY